MTTRFKIAIVRIMTALFLLSASGVVPTAGAAPAVAPPAQAGSCGTDNPATPAVVEPGSCTVTFEVHDFETGALLDNYNFIVNVDNTKRPNDPLALNSESNSPIARIGDQTRNSFTLPDGRYLVSARSLDHKMWGAYFTLPDDATGNALTVRVDLTAQSADHPLPLGKIRVFVFNDNTWTNGAPDTEEEGLGGFKVGLEEETQSAVTVDYNNNPLCGGVCTTSNNAADLGFVEIPNLGPAGYFINVQPPDHACNSNPNSRWYQTTTIDGGLDLYAPTEEGADGTGAPGEQLWEPPNIRTAYWFGFVCAPMPFSTSGTGEIVGQARNWVEWAPYTTGTYGDVVENPFVALSDASSDQTVFVGQGDANGNFDIQNVPAGDYNLSIWDEQLNYIMRFKPVHMDAGATVDVNDTGDDGSVGIGVSRWFGWLDGHVYKDVNNNGQYDDGVDTPIPNTDMDQRWRDGSIKDATFTDANGYYLYPMAEGGALGRWIVNEQGFARFSAFPGASIHDEATGNIMASCASGSPATSPCVPNSQGGGLLMNQLLSEGHRATVDWGKVDYPAGTPGQIVGITYFATTRNEFEAYKQAHEDYEPAIPDVTVYLETLGPDNTPNTDDDIVVNKYVTDHWQQPNPTTQDPVDPTSSFSQRCSITDFNGANIGGQFNPDIEQNCLEVPLNGIETKEGAFDGGYAFADYCPPTEDGLSSNLDVNTGDCSVAMQPLVAGNYIVHVIPPTDPTDTRDCNPVNSNGFQNVSTPKLNIPDSVTGCLYRVVREEDVNVDLGNNFVPAIPPPPCNGDLHTLDQSTLTPRSIYYTGDQATSPSLPLCDKHLVVLNNLQNANADFNLMTNFRTDPNGEATPSGYPNGVDPTVLIGDVAEPARFVGQVFNDIYFDRNQMSNWYGEPRPIGGIPVGIYARVDSCSNLNNAGNACPGGFSMTGREIGRDGVGAPIVTYDSNKWRLLTTVMTSPDGSFEALVPSSETWNCPIPQGPCPGMYMLTVNDPGFIDGNAARGQPGYHANANYNPNVLFATTPASAWPGLTNEFLDLPLDPISGTACEDPAGGTTPDPSDPARPDLLQVNKPYVLASDTGAARQITIQSDFIGPAGVTGITGGHVNLTDIRTGVVTNLTRANGGVVSWTPGSGSTPDTIVIQVPAVSGSFTPGPKQLTIVTAGGTGNVGVSSVNGITLHVLGNGSGASTRADTATTFNGRMVRDALISAADAGRAVSGTGIPAGTTISSVSVAGGATTHYFIMNNAATQTGFQTVTITKTVTGTISSGSHTVTGVSPAMVAADVGRSVTFSGAGVTGTRTITAQSGTSFTFSGAAATANGSRTVTITKIDPLVPFLNDGTFVYDSAAVAGDVGKSVSGLGIPAGSSITSLTSFVGIGSGFVMNNAATATSYPGTVSLTISSPAYPAYSPAIVNVAPPPPAGAGSIQAAINGAADGSLIVLSAGTYNENVLVWKPVRLQGLGPGGVIGAHELQGRDPEDPRFNIKGSIIDGRFIQQNLTAFNNEVANRGPFAMADAPLNVVLNGADLTVVAQSTSAFDVTALPTGQDSAGFGGARIDGLGLTTGHGQGAGGVQLMANINNMQITNNVLENNGGVFAGGVGVGQIFARNSHNWNVRMSHDRFIGNGGLTTSGGIGIFYDSNNYDVANSVVCSNFSVEYGAGISHIGLSPNGNIHDNRIYYNESVDSGGGIAIESELPVGGGLGDGSGAVNVDRNLIQSNTSTLDDGGGMFLLNALDQPINIRNNMIVNNVAADLGGAIMLDDSSKVSIINNTIANNVTTASSENSAIGVPHGAGLTSEANEPAWQTDPLYAAQYPNAATRPFFSNPVALFNNIFWNNDAMTLSQFGPGATLVDNGFIDFEVAGTCAVHLTCANDTFTPRYSDLTNGLILRANNALNGLPGNQANLVGVNPLFVTPFVNELTVAGSRLDPQQAAVTITGADPPVGLTGDYHLTGASPVVDRGAGFSNLPAAAPLLQTPNASAILAPCSGTLLQSFPADFDSAFRPTLRVNARVRTPWDLGADELPGGGTPAPRILAIPGSYTQGPDANFDWNGSGQLQCSASTVPMTP